MAGSHGRLLGLCILLVSAGRLPAHAPERDTPVLSSRTLAARIDWLIDAEQVEQQVTPAPLADDAEFMRRIYLDLTGRIPSVAEARGFLADTSPERRAQLVDRLLDKNPRYALHLGNTWCALMLPPASNPQMSAMHSGFKLWLNKQFQENVAYDKMVRDLLTVPLNVDANNAQQAPFPAAYFFANERRADNIAASTSRIFLGVRLECAQCHNHPFASWTRQQFWQFAAFFDESRGGRTSIIPATGKIAEAGFLDGTTPPWKNASDSRTVLADWVTSRDNPRFARTAVNRLWAHFFGIGIIDPMDDEATDENPPSHPQLLAELSFQFVANDCDMKYLIRAITLSKAYQRTSMAAGPRPSSPRLFARMAVRGMSADQLFDSLALATGYQEPAFPPQQRGGGLELPKTPREEFRALFDARDRKTETKTSILQILALLNGKLVADATSLTRSKTLSELTKASLSHAERIETLYLATLSRRPRDDEAQRMLAYVNLRNESQQRAALSDVFWALLNCPEFVFNH